MTIKTLERNVSIRSDHTVNKVTVEIKELRYNDEEGNPRVYKVNQKPVTVNDDPFVVGYVTKLNNKRWGSEIIYTRGKITMETDSNSPVTSVIIEELPV